MKTLPILCLLFGITFGFFSVSAEEVSSVTIPVSVYEEFLKLKQQPKPPSVLVTEQVTLSGKLSSGHLLLKAKGQRSGFPAPETFIKIPENTRLRNCQGNAIVYKENDSYLLLAKGDQFSLSCEIVFSSMDYLKIEFGKMVMDVQTDVQEATVGEETSPENGLALLIQRKSTKTIRTVGGGKVVVIPRYHLTITTDQVRFQYQFEFENPNPNPKSFSIAFPNKEVVTQTQAKIPNELADSKLILQVPSGNSEVELIGQLPGTSFVPLFDSEEHCCPVHLEVKGELAVRRIAVGGYNVA